MKNCRIIALGSAKDGTCFCADPEYLGRAWHSALKGPNSIAQGRAERRQPRRRRPGLRRRLIESPEGARQGSSSCTPLSILGFFAPNASVRVRLFRPFRACPLVCSRTQGGADAGVAPHPLCPGLGCCCPFGALGPANE